MVSEDPVEAAITKFKNYPDLKLINNTASASFFLIFFIITWNIKGNWYINPLQPGVAFLYPLKISENL